MSSSQQQHQFQDDSVVPQPEFYLATRKDQNSRATEIRLGSMKRPHMRAFHCAWIGFFMAFSLWFSIAPLLGVIQDDLGLTRQQIWISTICSDVGTVLARFVVGPACDALGARIPMAVVLCLVSIPVALVGTVNTVQGLCTIRFFIGIAGSSFVCAQYWMGKMFVKEINGTTNAIVAGWGNLGGGVVELVMGAGLFPLFSAFMARETAWRVIFIFPAMCAFATGLIIARVSDDGPGGYYKEMKKNGTMDLQHASFMKGTDSRNAWLLSIAYACSFGVEITVNNAGSLYFQDKFLLTTEAAAAAASIFGMTNIFARAVGGVLSDQMNEKLGMQGRLILCTVLIISQGAATIGFSYCESLTSAIIVMIVMASFVNATEGAIFGIVPYINPAVSGSINGIVGMGGNIGGIFFGVSFYYLSYHDAFLVMGVAAMTSSLLYIFVHVPGCSRLWTRTGAITEFDSSSAAAVTSVELGPQPSPPRDPAMESDTEAGVADSK